ncbi:MAG: NTP transferase domain-containing protein [Streptosporangiaceae bacterium]|nr:NTP transferase domain-containing protein [Streptosporangiaceae bacterium]
MIILAGGRGRRLGGADKPGLVVGGRTLIGAVVAAGAAAGARQVIVVGPARAGFGPGVRFVTEEPPGGGPVPALRRGLAEAAGPWTALLAADLPFLRAGDLGALLRAAQRPGSAGAVLADDAGRPQWLAGCWRTAALRRAADGYAGDSLRGLLAPLAAALVRPERAAGEPPPWLDCDTPEDLRRALSYADAAGRPGPGRTPAAPG